MPLGQNLQLQSDGSEIICAIRAPHKFCDKIYHILRVMGKMSVPYIKNLGVTANI